MVNHGLQRLGPISEAMQDGWGSDPPTQTLIGVVSLAMPDILFEVEAVAARP